MKEHSLKHSHGLTHCQAFLGIIYVRLYHIKYQDNFKINTTKACKSAMWLHIHPCHNGHLFMKYI